MRHLASMSEHLCMHSDGFRFKEVDPILGKIVLFSRTWEEGLFFIIRSMDEIEQPCIEVHPGLTKPLLNFSVTL